MRKNSSEQCGIIGFGDYTINLVNIPRFGNVIDIYYNFLDVYRELELFALRNLIEDGGFATEEKVCMRCMKAFLLDISNNYGLGYEEIESILQSLGDEEVGHNGYYIDNEVVKKMDEDVKFYY
jgi:hypothetical protein